MGGRAPLGVLVEVVAGAGLRGAQRIVPLYALRTPRAAAEPLFLLMLLLWLIVSTTQQQPLLFLSAPALSKPCHAFVFGHGLRSGLLFFVILKIGIVVTP